MLQQCRAIHRQNNAFSLDPKQHVKFGSLTRKQKQIFFHSALLPLAEPKRFEHFGVVLWFETKFKDMSMLNLSNQAAVEALCSGTYLENYLDTIESLPDDLQRNVTLLRELDIQSRGMLKT